MNHGKILQPGHHGCRFAWCAVPLSVNYTIPERLFPPPVAQCANWNSISAPNVGHPKRAECALWLYGKLKEQGSRRVGGTDQQPVRRSGLSSFASGRTAAAAAAINKIVKPLGNSKTAPPDGRTAASGLLDIELQSVANRKKLTYWY